MSVILLQVFHHQAKERLLDAFGLECERDGSFWEIFSWLLCVQTMLPLDNTFIGLCRSF